MSDKSRKVRLDQYLVSSRLVKSRHQAIDLIKCRQVKVNGFICDKPAWRLDPKQRWRIKLLHRPYVGRGGFKLQVAAETLGLEFANKIILDVGANCGGFTDYVLRQGARAVVAVDVGSQSLDGSLRLNPKVKSFIKTDIRSFVWPVELPQPDMILVDVSFIGLRMVLPSLKRFVTRSCQLVVLAKPQFEAVSKELRKGMVKNKRQRRLLLAELEAYLSQQQYQIVAQNDAAVSGMKGNQERFYILNPPVDWRGV